MNDLAKSVFDLATAMNRARAEELRAEPQPKPYVGGCDKPSPSEAKRLHELYVRITADREGNVRQNYEGDWVGTIEGHVEELEEQRGVEFDALQCARKQVKGWIEKHMRLDAIALQELANIMGVSLVSHDFRERTKDRPEHDLDVAGRPLREGT